MTRVLLGLTALILALGLSSCGNSRSAHPADTWQAQVDTLPLPAGVDAATWEQLKSALRTAIATRTTSAPPTSLSASPPLAYADATATLSWGYYAPGDCDGNGEVNISDLTPLGINLGKTAQEHSGTPTFPPDSQLATIDGDNNGEINIADVTPIGVNFGLRVEGYRVYQSENQLAYPDPVTAPNGAGTQHVDTVPFSQSSVVTGQRRMFSVQVTPTTLTNYFWVRPFDGPLDGTASSVVTATAVDNYPPVASFSAPPTGDTPAKITYDATLSDDPDGNVIKYEWDFNADGVYELADDFSAPTTDFWYYGPGTFTTILRVTDEDGATDTFSADVVISEVAKWHASKIETNTNSLPAAGMWLMESGGKPVAAYYGFGEGAFAGSVVRRSDDDGETWVTARFQQDSEPLWGGLLNGMAALLVRELDGANLEGHLYLATNAGATSWSSAIEAGQGINFGAGNFDCTILEMPSSLLLMATETQDSWFASGDQGGQAWNPAVASALPFEPTQCAVIAGLPAFIEIRSSDRFYWRLLDESASTNADPLWLEDIGGGSETRLIEVDGNPALIYGGTTIEYVRAADSEGTEWGHPIAVTNRAGHKFEVAIIDGRAAIIFADRISQDLRVIAANDQAGRSWSLPVIVTAEWLPTALSSLELALADMNGMPASAADKNSSPPSYYGYH